MFDLILCLIVFVFAFLIRFILYFINKKSKKKRKHGASIDIVYLVNKFDLNQKKMDNAGIAALLSFTTALIMSVSLWISVNVTEIIALELLIGLVIVVSLIYIINEMIGHILLKRGYGRNDI